MITRDEADQIADKWVADSVSTVPLTAAVREFDLGYVVWAQSPADHRPLFGAGRGIIDRETGELSGWPSLPIDTVIEQFREKRAESAPAPRTWDPAEQARRDLHRVVTPATVSRLTLTDRAVTARSVKGDQPPNLHPLVRDYLDNELPAEFRERGYDRCSEAAAFSDALHAEDARRAVAGEPPIGIEQARAGLFAGAGLVTYRVREAGDPVGGESAPPCLSCAMLSRHFGFQLRAPWERS
jgi:hypothetical protein